MFMEGLIKNKRPSFVGSLNPNFKGGKVEQICKNCGKIFYRFPSAIKYGNVKFCSQSCSAIGTRTGTKQKQETKDKIGKSHIGLKKGIKLSKEHKIKIGLAGIGRKMSQKSIDALIQRNKGNKFSLGRKKELSGNWKGGTTPLFYAIRGCLKYRQWRSDCFTRDEFICQECFIKGGYLEVHHIKEFNVIIKEYTIKTLEQAENCEELWNINNGRTLCKKCHYKITYPNK